MQALFFSCWLLICNVIFFFFLNKRFIIFLEKKQNVLIITRYCHFITRSTGIFNFPECNCWNFINFLYCTKTNKCHVFFLSVAYLSSYNKTTIKRHPSHKALFFICSSLSQIPWFHGPTFKMIEYLVCTWWRKSTSKHVRHF